MCVALQPETPTSSGRGSNFRVKESKENSTPIGRGRTKMKYCVDAKEESSADEELIAANSEEGHPEMIVQRGRSKKCKDKANPLYTYLVRYTDEVHLSLTSGSSSCDSSSLAFDFMS